MKFQFRRLLWRIAPNVSGREMGQPIKTCNVGHYGSTFHTHFYGQYLPKLNYGIKCPFTSFFSGRRRKRRGVSSLFFLFFSFLSSPFFLCSLARFNWVPPFALPPPFMAISKGRKEKRLLGVLSEWTLLSSSWSELNQSSLMILDPDQRNWTLWASLCRGKRKQARRFPVQQFPPFLCANSADEMHTKNCTLSKTFLLAQLRAYPGVAFPKENFVVHNAKSRSGKRSEIFHAPQTYFVAWF